MSIEEYERTVRQSLTLKKKSGAVVQTLPVSTRVDFAQYVGMTEFLTAAIISAGQQIMAFGELDTRETQLDAINGHIGMLLTTVRGTVVNAAASGVIVELSAVDGCKIDQFDFTGTGAASDADPDNYEVKTGSLNIAGLQAGDPVKLRGFVTEFGHYAASGDFTAQSVLNVSDAKGLMLVTWELPAYGAITDLSADNFTLNLSGAGSFHHLNRAGVVTDLTVLDDANTILTTKFLIVGL